MRNFILIITLTAIAMTGCGKKEVNENPFLNEKYGTPFEVPPFEKIKAEHYKPAYLKGIEEQKLEIRKIITNSEEPTFVNTIKALEYSEIGRAHV